MGVENIDKIASELYSKVRLSGGNGITAVSSYVCDTKESANTAISTLYPAKEIYYHFWCMDHRLPQSLYPQLAV